MTPAVPVSVRMIVRCVAIEFGVEERVIYGPRRDEQASEARQVVCWLARNLTELSTGEIGRQLGKRDHTSVSHGKAKIAQRRDAEPDFAARVDAVAAAIRIVGTSELATLLRDPDPVEVAERVARDPLRESLRVSTLETAALAVRLLALDEIAGGTFALLARHDIAGLLIALAATPEAAEQARGTRDLIDTISSALAALGYAPEEPQAEGETDERPATA